MKAILILLFAVGVAYADGPNPDPTALKIGDATTDNQSMRKLCTDAMNADPTFAKKIVEIADKEAAQRRLDATEKEHLDAAAHVEKDQRHVILAYAAMWIIAAGFVLFLWRRQQGLKAEIAQLRSDLEKEEKEAIDHKKADER